MKYTKIFRRTIYDVNKENAKPDLVYYGIMRNLLWKK